MKQHQNHSSNVRQPSGGFTQIVVKVKTARSAKPDKVVAIKKHPSVDDLNAIKQSDAFLYYSIPKERRTQGSSSSIPGSEDNDDSEISFVNRKSRVSFECHPSLLLTEMMLNPTTDYGSSAGRDDEDDLDFLAWISS